MKRWRTLFQALQMQALVIPQITLGTSLCLGVFFLGLQTLEATLPGGQPIWELSVTAQVRCKDGHPELPKSVVLNATLPQNPTPSASHHPQTRSSKRARFSIPQGISWGRDGSLFLDAQNGLPRKLGQLDLNKIRCLQPLEAEAAGIAPHASFEITLPLWMDPSSRINLSRKPAFPCVRQGRDTHPEGGLFRSAFAQESAPQVDLLEGENGLWSRRNQDTLQLGHYGESTEGALQIQGTNLSLYQTWAACRLGELEKGSVLPKTR